MMDFEKEREIKSIIGIEEEVDEFDNRSLI